MYAIRSYYENEYDLKNTEEFFKGFKLIFKQLMETLLKADESDLF